MPREIAILGAGGFGRETLDSVRQHKEFNCVGFFDDTRKKGAFINDSPVLGSFSDLEVWPEPLALLIAIGDGQRRKEIYERFHSLHAFPVFVHPKAEVSPYANVGQGSIIQAFSIVAANSELGLCCVVNANSGVGHDAKVGDFCSIMSFCDISGSVRVGDECFLGTGATIAPKLWIGRRSFICAGSLIVRDVNEGSKMMGNPARVIGGVG